MIQEKWINFRDGMTHDKWNMILGFLLQRLYKEVEYEWELWGMNKEETIKFRGTMTQKSWLMIHTTLGPAADWRIVAGFCPLIRGVQTGKLPFSIHSTALDCQPAKK